MKGQILLHQIEAAATSLPTHSTIAHLCDSDPGYAEYALDNLIQPFELKAPDIGELSVDR